MFTDFQNYYTVGKRMKFATKHIQQYPPHLSYVATLPWEIKNSNFLHIFSRYRRKCKKLHFKCSDFNSSTHATVYAECIYVFLSKSCSHRWIPCWFVDTHCSDCCDEFPVPQIDRKSKQVKEQCHENFICNQYGKNSPKISKFVDE